PEASFFTLMMAPWDWISPDRMRQVESTFNRLLTPDYGGWHLNSCVARPLYAMGVPHTPVSSTCLVGAPGDAGPVIPRGSRPVLAVSEFVPTPTRERRNRTTPSMRART